MPGMTGGLGALLDSDALAEITNAMESILASGWFTRTALRTGDLLRAEAQ